MAKRIGKKKAVVAAASKLLKIIYWILKEKGDILKFTLNRTASFIQLAKSAVGLIVGIY